MIQKMEAWILSQPESILKAMENYYINESRGSLIEDEIFSKEPENIVHPDDKLNTILSRYFYKIKRKIKKKKKYGKLKDAPSFIQYLDGHQLKNSFQDVKNLFEYLQESYKQ